MLDAIAQTLAEQAAKPATPATVNPPRSGLVVPQQTAAPVLRPIISHPESLSPSFSPPSSVASRPTPVPAAATSSSAETATAVATPHSKSGSSASLPTNNIPSNNTAATTALTASEQATTNQRLVLEQRLAAIVAREKPLKEAKLRASLEAMAIAAAQARQFAQARQLAHDAILSADSQAELLAQIDALGGKPPAAKSTLALHPSLLAPLQPLPKRFATTLSANSNWLPTTVNGRSLPSNLAFLPAPSSPPYSDVAPTEPNYVHYALNGFGQALGGIGVVVDPTPDFNGQNWTAAYAPGNFNAELWKGLSFIFPLAVPAPITSGFGWRVHPIRGDRRFHSGTDLGALMGTPVLAAASGKVAVSDWMGGYGLAIVLSHQDDTRETLYGHLSQVFVKPGQWVEQGTVIGRVGSTGLSTGPHLHFELRQKTSTGWQAIDPGGQLKNALARLVKAMREG